MSTDAVRMSQWPSDQRYVIPVAPGPDVVTVTIDGKEVQAPRGELLIKVAQEHGTYIPRFCWHERMKPVGMCRMCLVEVEGMRGMQISCATPVTDGMVVNTQSPEREGGAGRRPRVPADQPPARLPGVRPRRRVPAAGPDARVRSRRVALRRGEASLREAGRRSATSCCSTASAASSAAAARASRPRSPATRSSTSVSAAPTPQVITYPDEPFSSYFSGNTVQICPVGALTASSYRFRARPWDLADGRDVVHHVRGRLPRRAAEHVEPHRAPARRRLRAGEPGLALRQGSLRLRVGALRRARPHADGAQERRAGRGVVARGARRRRRRAAAARSTPAARRRSRCSAVHAAPTRTPTCGRASPRACSVPTTSTRSSATASPPRSCSDFPAPPSPTSTRAAVSSSSPPTSSEELPVLHLRVRRAAVELGVPVDRARAARHRTHP